MAQNLALIDRSTGEIIDGGQFVYLPKRTKIGEPWAIAFQSGLLELATDTRLTPQALRVLLALYALTDYENELHVTQAMLARRLAIPRQRINEAFQQLQQTGYLYELPEDERAPKRYRLGTKTMWRGSVQNLRKARKPSR